MQPQRQTIILEKVFVNMTVKTESKVIARLDQKRVTVIITSV